MALPPSRYRVEERGRRLVTIDTHTGREYGADMALGPAPVRSQPVVARTAAPPTSTDLVKQRSALSAVIAQVAARQPQPVIAVKLKPGGAGKLIALVAGGLVLAVFLIVTNLWILVVLPLAIPQVRSFVLPRGMAALKKYLDQAATG